MDACHLFYIMKFTALVSVLSVLLVDGTLVTDFTL
jgi:hypothetical protein